jgi:alpha-2-macroglobulin
MIDHDAARALAATALDFDLSAQDDQRLLAHMVGCVSCRTFAEDLDADARAIAGMTNEDAPVALRSRILDAVPATEASPTELPIATTPRPPAARGILTSIPRRYRGPLALTAAAAVVVALVGGMLVWRPAPSETPNVAGASAGSSASATAPIGSGSHGTPVPTVEPGSRLAASPWTQVADLTADDAASGVVGLASGFRLKMLDGTSAVEAARRLMVEPPIAFSTTAEPDGTVRITPAEPLTPGAAYRFSLSAADGHEVGSWAFQAHQPLRVVGTVPDDTETGVPSDTGIEVHFDQDGVVDAESHISIQPAVDGRYEMHGRTLAFVPDRRLNPATIYTVTVSPGIAVGTTDQRLEQGVTFRFETAASDAAAHTSTFQFSEDLFESSTADRPIVAAWFFQDFEDEDNPPSPPTNAPLEIYRVDGLDAAMDTYRAIRAYPRWTRLSSADLVPTAGLTQVMAFDARLQATEGVLWTELPDRLPAGWYLIQMPSPTRPIQAMLQVTDIASYLVVSDTKTLLWTNDLATKGPLTGAVVATAGSDLGRTGADGTLLATTPPAFEPEPQGTCAVPCVALVTVKDGDRSAFVPASESSDPDGKEGGFHPIQDDGSRYWHTLFTDRSLYRSTDTVHAWGVIRDRDTGKVPDDVTIALTQDDGSGQVRPAIVTQTAHPNAIGAFTSSLRLDALPEGSYALEVRTGGRLVTSVGFQIDRILKPAYRLDVTTGRRIYVEGDQIRITAQATFYEGTPVPGVDLRADGLTGMRFKTDPTGTASRKTIAHITREDGDESTGPEIESITITPATNEEGQIASSSRDVVVFPSHWTIGGTATISDGRVHAKGILSEVARDRLEREVAGGADPSSLDPAGKAIAGRTVTLTFIDVTTNRVQSGTRYDFIEKKVVPTYEYETKERIADTVKVRTDSKGRFTASIRAQVGHAYRIRATAKDTDGHTAGWIEWANQPDQQVQTDSAPTLTLTAHPEMSEGTFGVGDTIDVRMSDPTAAGEGPTDRYLFTTAQRGLRDVAVQDSARFRTTFGRTAPPGLRIDGVRFNGSRYSQTTAFQADFDATDRALTVGLSTDAPRYAPGADVRLTVTTRDRSGHPVASSVVLRAVDEKLFTLGAAAAADPLGELYAGVDSGIRVIYRSHRSPRAQGEYGGGDTTGGGRDDFRDSLLFTSVDTGSDGRASVTMHLSDDLTSWRVSASAMGAGLTAGEGSTLVPVGLPFFVDATIAPEYLVSDRPEIGLRAFGTALRATSGVTFAVDSDSLGLHVDRLTAHAFETVRVPLPALSLGRHEVTVTARTGSGAGAQVDRLTRTFTVVGSRLERTRTGYQVISGVTHVDGGRGLTEITVTDAGVGRYAPLIIGLTDTDSGRLENALAAAVAGSLAKARFAATDTAALDAFDGGAYQTPDGGLSLVPYASSDLEASVLAALVAPDRFDTARLTDYLTTVASDPKETRERRMFALAGLAGLRAGVLPQIRAAATDPDLTIRERLLLGLGAAALGDAATAHSIATSLIEGYGEAAGGDLARLRVGSDAADVTQATALMAMLAAATDDPLAPRFWSYVDANPDTDATYALHAVGFVTRLLDHATPAAGSFAYVSGGKRTAVTLRAGEAFHLTLVPSQVPDFTLEPVTGVIAVTTSWREPVDPASFTKDQDLALTRTITPSGVIKPGDLVTVDFVVDLGKLSDSGCHVVTDLVPSGLVPVGQLRGWVDSEDEQGALANATYPYAVVGQRVDFCAEPRADGANIRLRYVARVISTGTYTWETAIAQSPLANDRAALTGATTITIR